MHGDVHRVQVTRQRLLPVPKLFNGPLKLSVHAGLCFSRPCICFEAALFHIMVPLRGAYHFGCLRQVSKSVQVMFHGI